MTCRIDSSFCKTPTEKLDYRVDWATWLGADTITTSTWTVPTGLTSVTQSNTTTDATIWIESGSVGTSYILTNSIITTGGRKSTRSFILNVVKER